MRPTFEVADKQPYFDNATTTRIPDEVVDAMRPYLYEEFADPGEEYNLGTRAAEALASMRAEMADMVGADPKNFWFTSGGTEANNWAIRCAGHDTGIPVCSEVEHLSVIKPVVAGEGEMVTVEGNGKVVLDDLAGMLEEHTVRLVSIQRANQETGVIQDIPAIAEICHKDGVPLHVDACMSFGWERFRMDEWGADFITLSSHKVWGPVGCGALVSSGKYQLEPFMLGGDQEGGMRAGPVPMALVAGFHAAMKMMWTGVDERVKRVTRERNRIESDLAGIMPLEVFGKKVDRLANFTNLALPDSDSTFIAADLEHRYGMAVGVGGAAEAGNSSRVLTAMKVKAALRRAALRFRFGPKFGRLEADQVIVGLSSSLREQKARAVV